MISTARKCKGAPGFTLLEIVMVLIVACMMMAGAAGLMIYSSDEHELRKTSGEIELLAKRARTTAILKQTPYALEFRQGIVRLLPLAEAGRDEKKTAGGHRIGGDPVTPVGGEHRQYVLPGNMNVSIRRWNSTAWLATGTNSIHLWRFDPTGLCEPIGVRFSLNQSYAEDTYHPLTATIRDSQSETR
jgi:prepilin-type N-terminal cleavage/methylation domain-containing protein